MNPEQIKELSRMLHRAFDLRQEQDYSELPALDEEIVATILTDARKFVLLVSQFLLENGYISR